MEATLATDEWLIPILRELVPRAELDKVMSARTTSYWRTAVAAGIVTDETILDAIAARTRMLVAPTLACSTQARDRIPERIARRYAVLPLSLTESSLNVATGNPYDLDCEQMLAFVAGRRVHMSLASPARIAERLEEVYRPTDILERLLASVPRVAVEELPASPDDPALAQLVSGAQERPIIKLVDHIVAEGIALRASDIHLETEQDAVAVRYRVDGVLCKSLALPKAIGLPLVSRVKIMSGMDIADRLRPQGGRAVVTVEGARIDLRVSTLPAAHGEKVVIRILDSRGGVRSLDSLGLDGVDSIRMRRLLETREGLILVTGPTGSGKTTTLYAALNRLLERGLNIITVEDPVEYRVPGMVQSQVNEKAGLTFAAALRSILRQDPDVILVGEIRDHETAAIALQAALTGHLVFATLHTIDAASSITRLHDLGAEPAKVAAALKGIIAQRLVRRMCDGCRAISDGPVPAALWDAVPSGAVMMRGGGCTACAGSGYKGRLAVMELIVMTPELTQMVASAAATAAITNAARAAGMRSLWASGVARVLTHETTADEVARVLDPERTTLSQDRYDFDDGTPDAVNERREGERPDSSPYFQDAQHVAAHHRHEPVFARAARVSADRMTELKVGVVDVYIVDPTVSPWLALSLRRASGTRCPGAWEAVHGHIEEGEAAEDAAMREVLEETGLDVRRLYNVTVHAFYLHQSHSVQLAVVFCAFADSTAAVTLGNEHTAYEWLPLDEAGDRYIWPRAAQALVQISKLLGSGDAGPAEDVLRVR